METAARQWFFIVNPAAGNGWAGKHWPEIAARLHRHLPGYQFAFTTHRGHAAELAEAALRRGFRCIAAVGGDGTNNEAVNGLVRQDLVPLSEILYTLLPIGTGNDWIRTHGIPRNIEHWLEMISSGTVTEQEVGIVDFFLDGRAQRRYFVNVAGLAYDAFVVRYSEQNKRWVGGSLMYLALILFCLFKYRLSKLRVRFDGQERSGFYYTINAGVCRYSGGGMQVVPHADPQDGLLALTLAGRLSKLGVLLNTWRFYNASIGQHPKVELHQAQHIVVESADGTPVWVEADGELLGQGPVGISLDERKLRVLRP